MSTLAGTLASLARCTCVIRCRHSARGRVRGHQEILHLRISAAAVGYQADVQRRIGLLADFVRAQQRERGPGLLEQFEHRVHWGRCAPCKTKHHVQLPPPFYRQPDSLHLDAGCEKAQYRLRSGMKLERRRDQQQPRRLVPQLNARKVAVARKTRRGPGATSHAPSSPAPAAEGADRRRAFSSTTASRPVWSTASRSSTPRSPPAKAGTCPYTGSRRSVASRVSISARACDSSHASGYCRYSGCSAIRAGRAHAIQLLGQALDLRRHDARAPGAARCKAEEQVAAGELGELDAAHPQADTPIVLRNALHAGQARDLLPRPLHVPRDSAPGGSTFPGAYPDCRSRADRRAAARLRGV